MKHNKYDFVKIVEVEDRYKEFLGQEGMIIEADKGYELPFEVYFFDRNVQQKSIDEGTLLWRGRELKKVV